MTYSFSARAATKAQVMEKVSVELDKVVDAQPIHAADKAQAQAAAKAFLAIIPEAAEGKEFYVSVSGSLSWVGDNTLTSASVNVMASLVTKNAA